MVENTDKTFEVFKSNILAFLYMLLIIFLSLIIPFIKIVDMVLIPIPLIALYYKKEYLNIAFLSISFLIVSTFVLGLQYSLLIIIKSILISTIYIYCTDKDLTPYKTVICLGIGTIIILFTEISIAFMIRNISINDIIKEYMVAINDQLNAMKSAYVEMGIENTDNLIRNIKETINIENMLAIIPSIILVAISIGTSIAYVFFRKVMLKFNIKELKPIEFSKFYITNLVGAVLIGAMCIGIILSSKGIYEAKYVTIFIYGILNLIFITNGVASIAYFFKNKMNMKNRIIPIIIIVTLILQLGKVYFFVGAFEMIMDYRHLDPYSIFKRKDMGA